MTKKQRQLFLKKAKELLLSLGAVQEEDRFTMQTKVGRLQLHPRDDETIGLGTVFARFDDHKAAKKLVDSNPFSGKWNFHFFHGWTVETAMGELSYWLNKVKA